MDEERGSGQHESGMPEATEKLADDWLEGLDLGVELPPREFRLYARYVRALALLCECAPFVDDATTRTSPGTRSRRQRKTPRLLRRRTPRRCRPCP